MIESPRQNEWKKIAFSLGQLSAVKWRINKKGRYMRWYLNTRVISGTVDIWERSRSEFLLRSSEEGSFHIINTEESRGIENYRDQQLVIEGRVKSTSEGVHYLWVDRWWKPGESQVSITKKIS